MIQTKSSNEERIILSISPNIKIREKYNLALQLPQFIQMTIQTTKACTLAPQIIKTFEKCHF
jgi:hypothetical protein